MGKSTKHHLVKSDPLPRGWCGRERCPLTTSASTTCLSRCYTTNVNYEFYCRRCEAKIIEREEERRGEVLEEVERKVRMTRNWKRSSPGLPIGESHQGLHTLELKVT